MDTKSPRENEAILHSFVDQEDPHIVGLVGIEALTVLARELPTEKFKEFLQESINHAGQLKQAITPQQEPAPAANPEPAAPTPNAGE
jgi:hypothetical protein